MVISELVKKIIDKRHEELSLLESKSEMLDNLISAIKIFDAFKSKIVDDEGNLVDEKYNAIINRHSEMVHKLKDISSDCCKNSIVKAKLKLQEVEKRFRRDSVNISVIGQAKVGKSKLIQSISNLSDCVIPDFWRLDCTGAVSVIHNRPGTELEAHITFRSEAEMVEIVQTYLDVILPDPDKRMVVRTLNDIRNLDLAEVEKRLICGNPDNNLFVYLEKFVYNFEEWADCVRKEGTVLYDEDVIQTYFAQNNGKKGDDPARKNYYKYLAVKSCDIYCTFDYKEAGKITLIDTFGFGDSSLGIAEELLEVVNYKSDATVFMLLPVYLARGGISMEIENIYKKISDYGNNKKLDKQLYWLINHAPNRTGAYKNEMHICEGALKALEKNGWQGAMKKIIDVSNQDQVREEFFIPLLNSLLDNLDDIDNSYLKDALEALEDVKREYLNLFNDLNNINELFSIPLMQQYVRYFDGDK